VSDIGNQVKSEVLKNIIALKMLWALKREIYKEEININITGCGQ